MLVDTSVWVDHLRKRNAALVALLESGEVWTHPFVIGELACGNLSRRVDILRALAALPQAPVVEHAQVLDLIEQESLSGRGLGWIDMHLLASAAKARLPILTKDARLLAAAHRLGLPKPVSHAGSGP